MFMYIYNLLLQCPDKVNLNAVTHCVAAASTVHRLWWRLQYTSTDLRIVFNSLCDYKMCFYSFIGISHKTYSLQ